jgi:hypothetical protein
MPTIGLGGDNKQGKEPKMTQVALVALGLAVTLVAGLAVKPFLAWLRAEIVVPDISDDDPDLNRRWREVQEHPEVSGKWIGTFERIVLFGAFFVGSWEAVGIWLAFKLAAKWESRNHMGFVPDNPTFHECVHPLRWAAARRVWSAREYATFVVGTATNLLLAAAGALIANVGTRAICQLCHCSAAI